MNPLFSSAYKGYASALGLLGSRVEAAETRRTLLQLEPGFTVRRATSRSPLLRPQDLERYAEGLRLAGLPEGDDRHSPLAGNSDIDLVSEPPHSPVALRDSPRTVGRMPL
jgi:hypothetical protein